MLRRTNILIQTDCLQPKNLHVSRVEPMTRCARQRRHADSPISRSSRALRESKGAARSAPKARAIRWEKPRSESGMDPARISESRIRGEVGVGGFPIFHPGERRGWMGLCRAQNKAALRKTLPYRGQLVGVAVNALTLGVLECRFEPLERQKSLATDTAQTARIFSPPSTTGSPPIDMVRISAPQLKWEMFRSCSRSQILLPRCPDIRKGWARRKRRTAMGAGQAP